MVPVDFEPGVAGRIQSIRITDLEPESRWHFAVRGRDNVAKLGPVSNDAVEALPADSYPPSRITDLSVVEIGLRTVTLQWTAPGNDHGESRVPSYDLRYALGEITDANWERAVRLPSPKPQAPGEQETWEASGLPGHKTLWFAVSTTDEAGNQSDLSPSQSALVPDVPRVWAVLLNGTGDAPTIQAAVDSAFSGDTVLVHPGTYYEQVKVLTKNIVLRSSAGPEETIIDGSLLEETVVIYASNLGGKLQGFTIQNGGKLGSPGNLTVVGGGIRMENSSASIVENVIRRNVATVGGGVSVSATIQPETRFPKLLFNTIEDNVCGWNGGGINVGQVNAVVLGNVIRGNQAAFDGGGLYARAPWAGSLEIRSNQFVRNVARDHGGGIEFGTGAYAEPSFVEFNLFLGNEAHGEDGAEDNGTGGAIAMRGWAGTIRNNTFVGNVGSGGNGCTGGSILLSAGEKSVVIESNIFSKSDGCGVVCRAIMDADGAEVRNNLFWQNDPGDIVQPPECRIGVVEGNLFDVDPGFCDPKNEDFTLSADSPALTANPSMGAFLNAGCGGGAASQSATWSRIKTRFGGPE